MAMEYNKCETCQARNGRAGMLVNGECINCYQTRGTGNLVIHAHLPRTPEELGRTAQILTQAQADT